MHLIDLPPNGKNSNQLLQTSNISNIYYYHFSRLTDQMPHFAASPFWDARQKLMNIWLDKSGYQVNSFLISRRKHMLWGTQLKPIRFHREIRKIQIRFGWKKRLIKSYVTICHSLLFLIETPTCKTGGVQIQRRKCPFQKCRGEWGNVLEMMTVMIPQCFHW